MSPVRARRHRAPSGSRGRHAGGKTGTEVRFLASDHLHQPRLQLQDAGKPPARAGVPEFRRAHHPDRRPPRRAASSELYLRRRRARIRALPRPQQDRRHARARYIMGERDGVGVEIAMWWNDSYNETVLPFTNNIPQRDGGTHLAGFRGALTRTLNAYAGQSRDRQEGKGQLHRRRRARGADLRAVGEGARPEILQPDQGQAGQFRSAPAVEGLVNEKLSEWFEENPNYARMHRRQDRRGRTCPRGRAQGARADRARPRWTWPACPASWQGLLRKKTRPSPSCSWSRATAPAARPSRAVTRQHQAMLPLRGKILNVERARFDRMLGSQEIGTLITALGTGIGRDEFDISPSCAITRSSS